ncbi:SRPBCC domain-containing protein [Nocardia neocaledoniensis]|uniref:SRPBCC domain-containing protein n=1 Tax=Nocardia neocaledoniensis TaxID=236511 RepID=UPI00245846AF|nr:SRPBCC domain-containing protein [Nocardia neocaledoniensis]
MSTTRIGRHINAPRAAVYRLLLDADAVKAWMIPDHMAKASEVHRFEPQEGGTFSITLIYDEASDADKDAQHDAYYGRFLTLTPDEQVVEVLEFVTDRPEMSGAQTITFTLSDAAGGGTDLEVLHEGVPPGLSLPDNEIGWQTALAKLVALAEHGSVGGPQ